jgi:lauroyl/myristoyl acyltransferase
MFRRQVFRHQIISGLESIRSVYSPELLKISGFEEFKNCLTLHAGGVQGLVAITGHMGSWEICARYCVKGLPSVFHVLAKPSKNVAFKNFLERLRNHVGASVFWTDKKSLIKDILGALKKREAVGFVMDQKPIGNQGPKVNFLGQQTTFVSGPASMALHFNCPVFSFHLVRLNHMKYRLVFSELFYPQDISIENLTAIMAQNLEQVIRQYPEQWCWNYRRWKFKN